MCRDRHGRPRLGSVTRGRRWVRSVMSSRRHRHLQAAPETVWEVLSDGWLFPVWVVGASRMREVDDHWPEPGARLHHSVGAWPVLLDDETEVLESVPGSL